MPQLYLDINRAQVTALDLKLTSVFTALQGNLGAMYVNDFNQGGRTYQVRIQADAASRVEIDDIKRIEVRNGSGKMVPLGALLNIRKTYGPLIINRYNLYPSASVTGEAAPGLSSGQALLRMEGVANETLPTSMGYEWTAVSFQERQVGSQAYLIFALAVVLVYFVLAAQYESWTSPVAVILVVPLGMLGAAGMVSLRGMDNNVYTQIGLVLIIALASKNAILIVEFARELRHKGMSIREAAASPFSARPMPRGGIPHDP